MPLNLPDCAGCIAHAFGVGNEYAHGEPEDYDGESTCEYVNEQCPENCHAEHDAPSPNDNGQWSCPETGVTYNRCDLCDDWVPAVRHGYYGPYEEEPPVRLDDRWMCDPYEHNYSRCYECGEYVDCDNVHWGETSYGDEEAYCPTCWSNRQASRRRRSSTVRTATCCGTRPDYFDEYDEEFVCECRAKALRESKRPVLLVAA